METISYAVPSEGFSEDFHDPIARIVCWFEAAIPEPNDRNAHTQIGVHFEEVSEMARAFVKAGESDDARKQLAFAADVLNYFQRQLKGGDLWMDLDAIDRKELLEALCDQIVTAVGVAHMLGMDIAGALKEVTDSNDSKFGDDGKPVFDTQRKIMKGPRYRKPDLTPFTIK